MIGDCFLEKLFNKFQEMSNEHMLDHKAGKPTLYMLDCYNVKRLTEKTPDPNNSAIGRIINPLIETFNTVHRLPKYLIVVIDWDIIIDLNIFNKDAYKCLAMMVNWLTHQIDMAIRRKRLKLLEKKPGSVTNEEDPTVIYVNMVKRAKRYIEGSYLAKICTLRAKFNELLNDAAARQGNHVLSIRSLNNEQFFDVKGNLSETGRAAYWWELDELIEMFELKKVKLLPKPIKRAHQNDQKQGIEEYHTASSWEQRQQHYTYSSYSEYNDHDNANYYSYQRQCYF